jgi:hypothetical protein
MVLWENIDYGVLMYDAKQRALVWIYISEAGPTETVIWIG